MAIHLGDAARHGAAALGRERGGGADIQRGNQSLFPGFYGPAETAFGNFALTYSNSTHLAEAVLYQAEARIELTNYTGATALLSTHQAKAGTNADQYAFWLAEAQFRGGDYPAARDGFARLVVDYPASSRRLEAGLGEATARMRLGDVPGAIQVLQRPEGAFQNAVHAHATNDLVSSGYLMLADAHLAQKDYAAAEAALQAALRTPAVPGDGLAAAIPSVPASACQGAGRGSAPGLDQPHHAGHECRAAETGRAKHLISSRPARAGGQHR